MCKHTQVMIKKVNEFIDLKLKKINKKLINIILRTKKFGAKNV